MRTAFHLGRFCVRQNPQRLWRPLFRHGFHSRQAARWPIAWPKPPRPAGTKVTVLALLSPGAFVALSEAESDDGKTPEEHMLEASRAEIAKELPEDIHGLRRLWSAVYLGFDLYVFEPLATTFRFLHLVIIFLPVLATIPAIWLGSRRKDQGDERAGTLWWYSFLVHAMERAGPAFIKVSHRDQGRWLHR